MPSNATKGMGFNSPNISNNPPKGNNYLLVIGIDKYVHFPQLNNAVKDAKDMVDLLLKKFQFETDFAKVLYDQDATKENIYSAFRDLAERVTASDNLIIYFSGHGEFDTVFDEGYWIPIEAESSKVDQYVPNSMIKRILNSIKSHHIFLMIDSCFSGTLFAENVGRNAAMRKERDASRWGLTAGRNEVVNDGASGNNSPFAEGILYQLKNTNESIGVAELCDNVLEVVSANANQTPRGEPLKVNGHRGGQFVFHLKKDELVDWAECNSVGTQQVYQSFVEKYPKGKYTATAQAKIKNLQADRLWVQINKADDSELNTITSKLILVNQFVDDFESEPHYEEVLNTGQLLEYKKEMLLAQSSEFALRKFLHHSAPNVSGAMEIRNQAHELLNQFNSKSEELAQVDIAEPIPFVKIPKPSPPIPPPMEEPKVEQINKVNLNIQKENQPKYESKITIKKSSKEEYRKVDIITVVTIILIIAVVVMLFMSSSEESEMAEKSVEETNLLNQDSGSGTTSPQGSLPAQPAPTRQSPKTTTAVPSRSNPKTIPRSTPRPTPGPKSEPQIPVTKYKTHSVVIHTGNAYTEWNKSPAVYENITKQIQVLEEHKKGAVFKTVTEQVVAKEATVTYELESCRKINLVIDEKLNRSKVIDICQYYDPPRKITHPAEYATVSKRIMVTQGTGKMIPAQYRTKTSRKLVTPEKIKRTAKKYGSSKTQFKVRIKDDKKLNDHLRKAGIKDFKIR